MLAVPSANTFLLQDDLADLSDVQVIINELSNTTLVHTNRQVRHTAQMALRCSHAVGLQPTYAHLDFTWGDDANVYIYPDVLNMLNKYAGKR